MNLLKNMFLIFGLFVFIGNNEVRAQLNSNLMPVASIDREISLSNYAPPSLMEKDKCSKFKKMKGIGMGLMIGGGASLVLGTTLFVIGVASAIDDPNDPNVEVSDENIGLLAVGYVGMVFGVAGLASGIPLTIIGKNKSKQYCDKKTSSLNLVPTQKGVGLQLSF
ncbi:MAG: hypothetical protein IPO85_07435 [Saprospiraceae bacterium]|uniref:Uncharacterized protein n=1 Tax=Candidatus Defluviibacterium haderslevense TaxID=2981993 RepID=A0A9D7S7H0_9BACT|nr:hypothetical protein [Candidatus Defluviibacterium haderslevense]